MAWSRYSSHRDSRTTKNMDTVYHNSATFTNSRVDTLVGVRLTISNSTASRNEMMMTRAFTSHANHDRSLNLLTIFLRIFSAVVVLAVALAVALAFALAVAFGFPL